MDNPSSLANSEENLQIDVWALALKIEITLFSGARVVIAHKNKQAQSLNKNYTSEPPCSVIFLYERARNSVRK